MSTTPNNPFESTPSDQGDSHPQKKGSNVWLWVFGTIGTVVVIGGLVCCGGLYMAYRAGSGMMAEAFKQQLAGNPVIDEHIGQIESMDLNISATGAAAEDSEGALAFDIKGSKGSGTILIKQDQASGDGMGIASAELRMADGSRHEVPLEDYDVDEMEEIEIDFGEVDDVIEGARQEFNDSGAVLEGAAEDQ